MPSHKTTCPERDRKILAFVLAVNERNIASADLETSASEAERGELQRFIHNAAGQSRHLRDEVLQHLIQHGC